MQASHVVFVDIHTVQFTIHCQDKFYCERNYQLSWKHNYENYQCPCACELIDSSLVNSGKLIIVSLSWF